MATENEIHFYGDIQKFEASENDTLLVSGIASSEATDADGEVITADAMRNALPAYLQKGTVREMHQGIAAGTPVSAHVDDDGKTHFTALISDKSTIQKIRLRILKGFSIGGKALKKAGNKITEILLRDISVVDIPNNPESYFTVIKFDKTEKSMKKCKHCDEDMEKCMGKCSGAMAEKKKDETIDAILVTLDTLKKGFISLETKVSAAPAATAVPLTFKDDTGKEITFTGEHIAKTIAKVGDLEKKLSDATLANIDIERNGLIQKMQGEGRVVLNDDGKAYTPDELKKFDMPTLKILAKNAQVLPLEARAVYKGAGGGPTGKELPKGRDGKEISGEARTTFELSEKYSDLNKMLATNPV